MPSDSAMHDQASSGCCIDLDSPTLHLVRIHGQTQALSAFRSGIHREVVCKSGQTNRFSHSLSERSTSLFAIGRLRPLCRQAMLEQVEPDSCGTRRKSGNIRALRPRGREKPRNLREPCYIFSRWSFRGIGRSLGRGPCPDLSATLRCTSRD
jgi:hypothetical protein